MVRMKPRVVPKFQVELNTPVFQAEINAVAVFLRFHRSIPCPGFRASVFRLYLTKQKFFFGFFFSLNSQAPTSYLSITCPPVTGIACPVSYSCS